LEPHQDREAQERAPGRVPAGPSEDHGPSDRYIGAWEVRCGLQSEVTFRNALAEALEENFNKAVPFVNLLIYENILGFGRQD